MGFRFRKSIKIFSGLRLNLSKSGPSISIGGRGHSVNISSRGSRVNIGIPGTGLSYSRSFSKPSGRSRPSETPAKEEIPEKLPATADRSSNSLLKWLWKVTRLILFGFLLIEFVSLVIILLFM